MLQQITCNVSATFTTSFKRWSLPKTVRKPFYAGVQVICSYRLTSELSCEVYKKTEHISITTFFSRCSLLQVHPTSMLTFIICNYTVRTITLTPTIPARYDEYREWPMISFWLPKEIQLVNREKCEIPLKGITPVRLELKATCPEFENGASKGLKVIIPHISNRHSRFWNNQPKLPTIWVRKQIN